LEWRFLLHSVAGQSCASCWYFMTVRIGRTRDLGSSTMYGMSAAMTNTGFVALPILHAIYGQPAVLPAAIATVFVAAVMFPANVVLLEIGGRTVRPPAPSYWRSRFVLNPMVLSTLLGLAWTIAGLATAGANGGLYEHLRGCAHPVRALCDRLGLSVDGVRSNLAASAPWRP